MKPEIAKKWTAALRSGEYQQTTEKLRDHNAYCCLGVLCDLYAQDTGAATWTSLPHISKMMFELDMRKSPDVATFERQADLETYIDENGEAGDAFYIVKDDAEPPYPVLEWAGLDSGRMGDLIHMNDTDRASFAQIADFIDAKVVDA